MDEKDAYDGKSYFYISFLMNDKIELVRLLNGATPIIDYSYEFYDYSESESLPFKRLKDPAMIRMDPRDSGDYYWMGRY